MSGTPRGRRCSPRPSPPLGWRCSRVRQRSGGLGNVMGEPEFQWRRDGAPVTERPGPPVPADASGRGPEGRRRREVPALLRLFLSTLSGGGWTVTGYTVPGVTRRRGCHPYDGGPAAQAHLRGAGSQRPDRRHRGAHPGHGRQGPAHHRQAEDDEGGPQRQCPDRAAEEPEARAPTGSPSGTWARRPTSLRRRATWKLRVVGSSTVDRGGARRPHPDGGPLVAIKEFSHARSRSLPTIVRRGLPTEEEPSATRRSRRPHHGRAAARLPDLRRAGSRCIRGGRPDRQHRRPDRSEAAEARSTHSRKGRWTSSDPASSSSGA